MGDTSKDINLDEVTGPGRGKIKIKGQYLKALGLEKIESHNNVFKDESGYKYSKKDGRLYINYAEDEGISSNICITDFQEGDYGLWIKEESPYYIEGSMIVDRDWNEEVPLQEVKGLEGNQWLKEEERIKDGFLWVYGGENIIFPRDVKEKEETNGLMGENAAREGSTTFAGGQANSQNSGGGSGAASSDAGEKEDDSYRIPDIGKNSDYYVCHGAMLRCSKGAAPCVFNIIDKFQIYIQHRPMATINDATIANIPTFGTCARQYSPPCTPQPIGTWKDGKMDVVIRGTAALLKSSTLKCAFGGTISVVNPGQQIVKD